MTLRESILRYASLEALPQGSLAPELSLTADEGTWVKLRDFQGRLNVLLVFFRSMIHDPTERFLKQLQKARGRFDALDTVIFAVNQRRTDSLREYRSRLGLEYFLLYDPFALTSRSFGCSGRLRPYCKPSTVLLGKDGTVLHSQRGYPEIETLIERLAEVEGREVPAVETERAFTGVRDPGTPADRAKRCFYADLEAMMASSAIPFAVVDVRTAGEFQEGHIHDALNIPIDEMPHRYPEIGQTTHIVCVDSSGGLAQAAAEFLTSVGRSEVYYVEDGLGASFC